MTGTLGSRWRLSGQDWPGSLPPLWPPGRGSPVALLDVRSAGGRARSDERDDYVLNQGPHAVYRTGAGSGVLSRVGVALQGAPPHPAVAGYRGATGDLAVLPTSAASLLRSPLVGMGDKVRLGRLFTTLPKVDASSLASQSAAGWIDWLRYQAQWRRRPDDPDESCHLCRRSPSYLRGCGRWATPAGPRGERGLPQRGLADARRRFGSTFIDSWHPTHGGRTGAGHRCGRGRDLGGDDAGEDRASRVAGSRSGRCNRRGHCCPRTPTWELGSPATAACLRPRSAQPAHDEGRFRARRAALPFNPPPEHTPCAPQAGHSCTSCAREDGRWGGRTAQLWGVRRALRRHQRGRGGPAIPPPR